MKSNPAALKILCVSPMYVPALGGAELHLREVCSRLAARGHDVTVLTSNTLNLWYDWRGRFAGLPERETLDGVHVHRLPPSRGVVGHVLDAWQWLPGGYKTGTWMFGEDGLTLLLRGSHPLAIIKSILSSRADIVLSFNWFWPPAYYTYVSRKLKPFRLVSIPLLHLAEEWCHSPVYQRMLSQCDAVITNTEYEAAFVRDAASAHATAAGVGVQAELFSERDGAAIRERYGLGRHPVVGYVGRQAANKGAGTLIRAMRKVWQVNPDVRLLLAGPRPPSDPELDPLLPTLTDFEKQRIVSIERFSDQEKASIYDAMDIFALPSTGESFGIAYLEAWMCDKPVIGARIGATACVIEEGLDGLLVSPKSADETARAILELLSDRERRDRMGRRGHLKTVERFTWDKVTDRTERVLLDVVGRCNAGLHDAGRAIDVGSSSAVSSGSR